MRPNRRGYTGYLVPAEVALHGERIRRPPLSGMNRCPTSAGLSRPAGGALSCSRAASANSTVGAGGSSGTAASRHCGVVADVRDGLGLVPARGTPDDAAVDDDPGPWRSSAECERLGRNKVSPVQVGQQVAQSMTVVGRPAATSRPITGSLPRRRDRAGSAATGSGLGSGGSVRGRVGEPGRCECCVRGALWLVAVGRC